MKMKSKLLGQSVILSLKIRALVIVIMMVFDAFVVAGV